MLEVKGSSSFPKSHRHNQEMLDILAFLHLNSCMMFKQTNGAVSNLFDAFEVSVTGMLF
jgi:hypothetical protein